MLLPVIMMLPPTKPTTFVDKAKYLLMFGIKVNSENSTFRQQNFVLPSCCFRLAPR